MYIIIFVYLGKLQRPHCNLTIIMVNKGNHPQMAELFRLVNYYHLHRYMIYVHIHTYYPPGWPMLRASWVQSMQAPGTQTTGVLRWVEHGNFIRLTRGMSCDLVGFSLISCDLGGFGGIDVVGLMSWDSVGFNGIQWNLMGQILRRPNMTTGTPYIYIYIIYKLRFLAGNIIYK